MPHDITLKTNLGDKLLFARMQANEHLGQLFAFEVNALSQDAKVNLRDLLGTPMTVSLKTDDGYERFFNGIVCEAAQTGFLTVKDLEYAEYSFRLVPKPWLLTRKVDCRIYTEMSVPDIIQKVLGEFGYSDVKLTGLSTTYPKRDYCVQYREDYFNFISRLMEQEGIYYYFQHSSSTHTMILCDALGAHSAQKGFEKIGFSARSQRARDKELSMSEWTSASSVNSTKCQLTDYDPMKPKASLLVTENVTSRADSPPISNLDIFDYPGNYTLTEDGQRYASVRLEALNVPLSLYSGKSDACGICTGALFQLQNFPRKELNQEYLIVTTVCRMEVPYLASSQQAGEPFTCELKALPGKYPYRSLPTAAKPLIAGVQTATVVGASEGQAAEDISVDKYGRIQVTFNWNKPEKENAKNSLPVRVASFWAGKNWGAIHIPRIGQEVVVSFLEGDPDRPLVIGSVYNADNMPPYELPANMTQSGIKSRSHQGGGTANFNEIRFEDKKGSEQLFMHAEKDMVEEVENDHTVTIDHDEVETIKNDRTHNVNNNDALNVQKDRTTKIDQDDALTVSQKRTTKIGTDDTKNVGQNFKLEAGTQIQLVTGASSIVMKSSGEIEIQGVNIKIVGQAQVQVTAGATMKIESGGALNVQAGALASIQGATLKLTGTGMAALTGGIINIG